MAAPPPPPGPRAPGAARKAHIHSYRTPRPSPGALPRQNFIWIHGTYKVQRKHPLSYVECTHTDAGLAGMEY